jgi:hypothetical protein
MRWILGPLVLLGCNGGKNDSTGGGDDTSPDTGATYVTARTVGTIGPEDVDAIEIIHIAGGALAELTNVPEFNYLVEGTLPPKAAPVPPPIGDVVCITKDQTGDEEVIVHFDGCKDDRSGDVRLAGTAPTTMEFQDFGLFGYTVSGTVEFTVSKEDARYYDFVTTGSSSALSVEGNGRSVELAATGSVFPDWAKVDGVMQLNEDATVTESGTSRTFLVGNGGPGMSLQTPSPLTWSLYPGDPRRPINGTISFPASTGSYAATITQDTLVSEIGIPKDSAPLAGIPDIPITMDEPPVIGLTYSKTDAYGVQTEFDIYTSTAQTSEIVALAEKCALSQADCDALAAGIDDKLADEVTVDVDSATIVSAFASAYDKYFDPVLMPTK